MSGFSIEMMNQISNGQELTRSLTERRDPGTAAKAGPEEDKVTFADLLENRLEESNALIKQADNKVEGLLAGRDKDIHGTMIAMEKAEISFRMLMQVRNKMMEAYREIMRMQV